MRNESRLFPLQVLANITQNFARYRDFAKSGICALLTLVRSAVFGVRLLRLEWPLFAYLARNLGRCG